MLSYCCSWLYPQQTPPLLSTEDREESDRASETGRATRRATNWCSGVDGWLLLQTFGHFTASLSNAFPASVIAGIFFESTGTIPEPPIDSTASTTICTTTPAGFFGPTAHQPDSFPATILGLTAAFVIPSTVYKILTIHDKPLPDCCTSKGITAHVAGGFEALLSAHGTIHTMKLIADMAGTPISGGWSIVVAGIVGATTWNAMSRVHYNGINAALATAQIGRADPEAALERDNPENDFRWETVIDRDTPANFFTYAEQHPGRAFNVWFAHWGRGMAAYLALLNMIRGGQDLPCNGWALLSITCFGSLLAFAFPGRMGLDMAGYAAAEIQFLGDQRTHNLCCGMRDRSTPLPAIEGETTDTHCSSAIVLYGQSHSHPARTFPILYKRGALRITTMLISSATNGAFTAFVLEGLLVLSRPRQLSPTPMTLIAGTGLALTLVTAGAGRCYMSIAGGRRVGPLTASPPARPSRAGRSTSAALTVPSLQLGAAATPADAHRSYGSAHDSGLELTAGHTDRQPSLTSATPQTGPGPAPEHYQSL